MKEETYDNYNRWSDKLIDEYGEYYIGWTINTDAEFYIDADDFEKVKEYRWFESISNHNVHTIYARIDKKRIYMHCFLGYKGFDHIDQNELNNRKYNLRPCTFAENMRNRKIFKNNTSGVTGVSWDKTKNKWEAIISIDKKRIKLGCFTNKDDAIEARLRAAKKYHGEFSGQRDLFGQLENEL